LQNQIKKLVIVTLNTHSFQQETKIFEKLLWIAEGLKNLDADIIGLNEILYGNIYSRGYKGKYYDTSEIIKNHLECMMKQEYFLFKAGFGKWEDGEILANAILSKYPLYDSSYIELTTNDFWPAPYSKRNCIFSKIYINQKGYINFFVTHTMGYDYNDTRLQIKEIKKFVNSKKNEDTMGSIVMGDFNVPQYHKNYPFLIKHPPEFIDTFALANPSLFNKSSTFDNQHRIDYIFWVHGNLLLKNHKVESSIIFNDDYYKYMYYPIVSDHFGIVTNIL